MGEFEDYQNMRFLGTIGKDMGPVTCLFDHKRLTLHYSKRAEEYPMDMVEVSWAPRSVYIYVGHREIRVDVEHSHSWAEAISWYRHLGRVLATKLHREGND